MERLATNLVTGVICGTLAIIISIGNGGLVFVGALSEFIPISIGLALFAACIGSFLNAVTSSTTGSVIAVQEVPAIAMAGIAATVAAQMGGSTEDPALLLSVVVTIALATILCGGFSLLLGYYGLGSIVRYIPYPVIGGFLAGSGWLIVLGGLAVSTSREPSLLSLWNAPEDVTLKVTAAVVVALLLAIVRARVQSLLAVPILVIAMLAAFNLTFALLGLSVEELRATGWLTGLPSGGHLWPPEIDMNFRMVDWAAVAMGLLKLPTLVVVTTIAVLLNATGIEMARRQDIDLDRELVSVGWTNIFAGVGAGPPVFPAVSLTLLAGRIGYTDRMIGIVVGIMCLVALLFSNVVLNAVPTVMIGGMLLWIGAGLVLEWLFASYRRLDLWEYLVIVLIFLVIAAISFPVGITVGLIAAVVVFVIQYGQVDIVRHELTGSQHQTAAHTLDRRGQTLAQYGDAILIIRLQGYLFFGTADRLRRRIRSRITADTHNPLRYLIIDFSRVTGIDSSTVVGFEQLLQNARDAGIMLILSGINEDDREAFRRGGVLAVNGHLRFDPTLEAGMKWAEDALLADIMPEIDESSYPIHDLLSEIVDDRDICDELASQCERMELSRGDVLIEQGAPSDDLFFIESGQAAVEIAQTDGSPLRLATMGSGAVIGEISFYLEEPRSASIVAERTMVVWRLSYARIRALQQTSPDAAARFHQGIAAMLARRISLTNRLVRFLAN